MKKILILFAICISIVYCESCVVIQYSQKDKKINKNLYRSDVPTWLLRSI